MPPSVGMRFSRFELVSRIGAGGMGDVWRARDNDLHRDVAVKFLPERFAADPARLGRFAQEARTASSLNHPNIITIHEIGETSGLPYIVMELVDGQTLRDILLAQEGKPLPTRRLLEIGAQAADGLAKAHAAGIVHRDLKPENVMVTADGFVKVLDFGLAKLRAEAAPRAGHAQGAGGAELWFDSGQPTWPESPSPHTAVGAVIGTAGYMSPEQARGQPVDFRSDQFTLGAILYELATGRQAFRRETPVQTIVSIIEDSPEPLTTRNPGLPPPLRWVIERCLAKDPAERYASTLDLARELRGLREHLAEVGGSGSSPGATTTPIGRDERVARAGFALPGAARRRPEPGRAGVRERARGGARAAPGADAEAHRGAAVPHREPATPRTSTAPTASPRRWSSRLAQLAAPPRRSLWVVPASEVRQAGVASAEAARPRVRRHAGGHRQRPAPRRPAAAQRQPGRRDRAAGSCARVGPTRLRARRPRARRTRCSTRSCACSSIALGAQDRRGAPRRRHERRRRPRALPRGARSPAALRPGGERSSGRSASSSRRCSRIRRYALAYAGLGEAQLAPVPATSGAEPGRAGAQGLRACARA